MQKVDTAELRRLWEAAKTDSGVGEWGLVEDHEQIYTLTNGNGNCLAGDICYRSVAEFLLAAHSAIPALLDELEAAREMTAYAETYGELVRIAPKVAGAIVGHEWDNMRPVEQKRWLLSELSAARETVLRLTQANGDIRKERDRAVKEAQRQDGVAKWLRKELEAAREEVAELKQGIASANSASQSYYEKILWHQSQVPERDRRMKLIGAAEEWELEAGIAKAAGRDFITYQREYLEQRAAQLRQEAEGK